MKRFELVRSAALRKTAENVPSSKTELLSLDESIPFLLRDTHRQFLKALQAELGKHGISASQWYFLRALWDREGLTQAELSQRVGLMTPTTVTTLNKLEHAKLIERRPHPTDKRKYLIHLTLKGTSLKQELLPIARDVHVKAMTGLSLQQADLLRALISSIRVNLEHMNGGNQADLDGLV